MNNIAYQNKDIVSKILGEGMKEKSFAVYGVPMSKMKSCRSETSLERQFFSGSVKNNWTASEGDRRTS